jgi:hypothetical protein
MSIPRNSFVKMEGEKKPSWEPALIVYSESGDWGQEFV